MFDVIHVSLKSGRNRQAHRPLVLYTVTHEKSLFQLGFLSMVEELDFWASSPCSLTIGAIEQQRPIAND